MRMWFWTKSIGKAPLPDAGAVVAFRRLHVLHIRPNLLKFWPVSEGAGEI